MNKLKENIAGILGIIGVFSLVVLIEVAPDILLAVFYRLID